jgi:S1-C subfamily serine protease
MSRSKVRLNYRAICCFVLILACIGINPHCVIAAPKKSSAVNPPMLTLKQLVHLVMPSIVRLTVLNGNGIPAVQGSGFVVGPNLIATAYHVIKGAHAVTANFDNGRSE